MQLDSLGDRMKGYESVSKTFLMKRTPVIIRLDGKAFHTFTKKLKPSTDSSLTSSPFSYIMHRVMTYTTLELAKHIQNVKIGYTQSDEITLLLTDWNTFTTDQWFNGNIQKIVSVASSMATAYFNMYWSWEFLDHTVPTNITELAMFDARVFNLPKEEVTNNFIWRQNDASRNSVQMLGHYHFSQKQMHGLNNSQVQDLLMCEKGINWNDIPTWQKRGSCIIKRSETNEWVIDDEIPIFTQDRNYVNRYVIEED